MGGSPPISMNFTLRELQSLEIYDFFRLEKLIKNRARLNHPDYATNVVNE